MAAQHPDHELTDRITRLEESAAFAQHELEQLSAEIAALGRGVLELSRRLDAMERREAARRAADEEPPEAG